MSKFEWFCRAEVLPHDMFVQATKWMVSFFLARKLQTPGTDPHMTDAYETMRPADLVKRTL